MTLARVPHAVVRWSVSAALAAMKAQRLLTLDEVIAVLWAEAQRATCLGQRSVDADGLRRAIEAVRAMREAK